MSQDVKEIAAIIADFIEQHTIKETRDEVLKELSKKYEQLAVRYEFMLYEITTVPEPGLYRSRREKGDSLERRERAEKSNELFCNELSELTFFGWETFCGVCTGPNQSTVLRRRIVKK